MTSVTSAADGDLAGRSFEVVVIGGGPSGIGAAIRLRERGLGDFVLLEKASALRGNLA